MAHLSTRLSFLKYRVIAIGALFVLVLGAWFGYAWWNTQTPSRITDNIIKKCALNSDHRACYEQEVPKLYPLLTVPEIFDVVRNIRKRDTSYQFCHLLAHTLAEEVVSQDPDHWLDWIPYNPPDGLCSNGFIHGVIIGRFRDEDLSDQKLAEALPDFARACESHKDWRPSVLEQAICYHGLGHLYVFITNADLHRALSLCEQTANSPTNDFRRMCHEGVFMQIFQPLEPDDFALVDQLPYIVTADNYRSFCASYTSSKYVGACLREAWPMHSSKVLDGSGVVPFCTGQPAGEEENCYKSIFSLIGKQYLEKPQEGIDACMRIPTPQRSSCVGFIARMILEESRDDGQATVEICNHAPESEQDLCFIELARAAEYSFSNGSAQKAAFCSLLPQIFKDMCNST